MSKPTPTDPASVGSPFLDLDQAASYLHQKPVTLHWWAREGRLHYYGTPMGHLFTREDLDAYMHTYRHFPRGGKYHGGRPRMGPLPKGAPAP